MHNFKYLCRYDRLKGIKSPPETFLREPKLKGALGKYPREKKESNCCPSRMSISMVNTVERSDKKLSKLECESEEFLANCGAHSSPCFRESNQPKAPKGFYQYRRMKSPRAATLLTRS